MSIASLGSIVTSYSIVEQTQDSGYTIYTIKPLSLRNWAQGIEVNGNATLEAAKNLTVTTSKHTVQITDLAARLDGVQGFTDYIAKNYPHLVQEYMTAQQAKQRMNIDDDQPVTMGP